MNCTECEKDITKRHEVTGSTLCADCKSEKDDFKWKMKVVGFDESPTVAKTEKDWKILKKQRAVKDI